MAYSVSLNGPDNIGKTYQLGFLPDSITKLGSIVIEGMPVENSSQWWFHDCPTAEFTKSVVDGLKRRWESAEDDVGLTVLDRGVDMFKAVCIATCMIKDNLGVEDAWNCVKTFFIYVKHEDFKIFMDYGDAESSFRELESRDDHRWDKEYSSYQTHLRAAITFILHLFPDNVLEINCSGMSMVEVQNVIRSAVQGNLGEKSPKGLHPFMENVKCLVGLGGLSESGKSFVCQYFQENHNFIHLKIVYFDSLCTMITGKDYYDNPPGKAAQLTLIELDRFSKVHYYINYYAIDSLRKFEVVEMWKKMLGEKFVIIYLDAPEKVRYLRGSESDRAAFYEKDETKRSMGADKIGNIANHFIGNDQSVSQLKEKLDDIVAGLKRNVL